MPWQLRTLAACVAWLVLASPAAAQIRRQVDSRGVIHISNVKPASSAPACSEDLAVAPALKSQIKPRSPKIAAPSAAAIAECGIEIRNGTRLQNLAHSARTLLRQEGFSVVEIGNHIDFGAHATTIFYLAGEEQVARTLQAKVFPGAKLEEIARLHNGVAIKVLLGSDLLDQPQILARLTDENSMPASPQVEAAIATPKTMARTEAPEPVAAAEPRQELRVASAKPAELPTEVQARTAEAPMVAARAGDLAAAPESESPLKSDSAEAKDSPVAASAENGNEISNANGSESGTTPAEAPAAVVSTPEPAPAAVAPIPATPEQPQPALEAEARIGQDASPAQKTTDMIAAAACAAAQAASAAAAQAKAEETPAPLPQVAATTGGIRRYQDARGVININNTAPEGLVPAPAGDETAKAASQAKAALVALSRRPAKPAPGLPLQKVAWNPDSPNPAALPKAKPLARIAAPEAPNLICRYRDSKGVIHISNVGPEPNQAAPAPVLARGRSGGGSDSQGLRPAPTLAMGGWTLQRASWNGEGGIKPLKRVKGAPAQPIEVSTEGDIRRYRDKKGVIHIKTAEYPLPPGVVLPPRRAASPAGAPLAAAPLAPSSPAAPTLANPAGPLAPGPSSKPAASGAGAQITAFKDAKGKLHITTTLPQPAPAKNFPPMALCAEFEPFIQEAAQTHRLPTGLIRAVIKVESNFCSWAVSPKGAMGLMQLMPGTADSLGVREPFNPRENILGGCRYLRLLIDLFGGNLPLALAAYNAGFQRVIDCGYQVPAIKETQDFVSQVLGRYVAEEKRGPQPWT